MVTPRIAAPVRQAGRTIIDGGQTARPIVAGLARLADAATDAWRTDVRDDEADAEAAFRLEQEELQRQRAATIADRAGARAELLAGLEVFAAEARQNAKPGAMGHVDAIKQEGERRFAEFRATLGNDPEVVERFDTLLRGDSARLVGEERAFELIEFGKYQGDQWKKSREQSAVALQKSPTLETFNRVMEEGALLLDGMALPGNITSRLAADDAKAMAMTLLEAQLAGGNSAGVRTILQGKAFDTVLGPDERDALLRGADLVDQRMAREAEAAESEARDAARTTVKTVQAIIDGGADPTPAQMVAARKAVQLLPPDEQVKFASLEIDASVAAEVRGMPTAQIRVRRDALAAKVEAGQASQAEQFAIAAYERQIESAEDREAAQIKGAIGEGVEGRFALVNEAQGRGREDRFAVLEKVEPGLGYVSLLPRAEIRRKALEGAVVRKDRKALVDSKQAEAAYRRNVGGALAGQYEGYGAVMNVAMDLYAADAARLGKEEFDRDLFDTNVQLAFGAVRRDGVWYGGIGEVNGAKVVLPDGVSAPMLRSMLAKADWSGGRTRDGRPVSKAFVTSQMRPVIVQEDEDHVWYDMVDAAGIVMLGANGRPFRAKVPKQ